MYRLFERTLEDISLVRTVCSGPFGSCPSTVVRHGAKVCPTLNGTARVNSSPRACFDARHVSPFLPRCSWIARRFGGIAVLTGGAPATRFDLASVSSMRVAPCRGIARRRFGGTATWRDDCDTLRSDRLGGQRGTRRARFGEVAVLRHDRPPVATVEVVCTSSTPASAALKGPPAAPTNPSRTVALG